MTITLELNQEKAAQLQNILTTTLQSLVFQEAQIKDAIEDHLKQEDPAKQLNDTQYDYLLAFLTQVAPQRVLLAEVLSKFIDNAQEAFTPLETRIAPAQVRNHIDSQKEAEEFANDVIKEFYNGA